MRYTKRLITAIIIASTLFLNASLNREATTEDSEEGDPPPDILALTTYEVPALSDASKVIADDVALREAEREAERQAERQRIKDEEAARIAEEKAVAKAEAERLEAVEKERLAAIERERLATLEAEREAVRARKSAESVATVPAQDKPTEPSRSNTEQAGAGQAYSATFYTAFCDTGCTGVTATGLDVSNTIYTPNGLRIVAVDPAQIPLGSIVQVTLADGTVFNAEAADTGGAIKGRIVDVLVASKDEARRLGRQDIRVHIIRKGR